MTTAVIAAVWLGFAGAHRLLTGRHWLWLLADLIPPLAYLVVPLLLLAAAAFARSAAAGGFAAAALLVGAGHSGVRLGRNPPPDRVCGAGTPLHLVSWNTQYWHQHVDDGAFYRFLRGLDADVYALQEYVHGPHHQLTEVDDRERLRAEFPGYQIVIAGELVTLSRFPVVAAPPVGPARDLGEHPAWSAELDAVRVLRTDLLVGRNTLSVYNVHIPVQYVPGERLFRRGFRTRLRSRHLARAAQFRGLVADLDADRRPVVVAGDFNSTGAMGEMRPLFSRLTPANRVLRHPYPASWPASGPALWQLDWAFTAAVGLLSYRLRQAPGLSDHLVQDLHLTVPHDRRDLSAMTTPSARSLNLLPRSSLSPTSEVDHPDWNYRPLLGAVQRIRFRLMLDLLGDARPGRLLEIGYGSGVFMPELANRCTELYGIDPHPFHDRVRARLAEHHVDARLAQGAVERLPYPDGLFDQAVAISSLEYVPDIEAACAEIRRVLRPGGRLAVVTPGANPLWDLALRLSTGESPGQYADRRQRLAPTLLRRFRLVERLRIPRLSGPRTRLYTGLLLSS